MPITRKQISAAVSTSNPPTRKDSRTASNIPISDDDLFEQSAIQVSSTTRQTRTITHQIPKNLRKQLHGAFKAAASAENNENIEADRNCDTDGGAASVKRKKMETVPHQRSLVKRSSLGGTKASSVKSSIVLAAKKDEIVIVDDNNLDSNEDSIFEVPVTSPTRETTVNIVDVSGSTVSAVINQSNNLEIYDETIPSIITTNQQEVSTPSKPDLINKTHKNQFQLPQMATLTTPSKHLNQVTSHQILAEVRRTPLTMAEKKRRQSIAVSGEKNETPVLLDKSTKTDISLLKPVEPFKHEESVIIDIEDSMSEIKVTESESVPTKSKDIEDESLLHDALNDEEVVDILKSDNSENGKTRQRKQFIRNQATESAPPDILINLEKENENNFNSDNLIVKQSDSKSGIVVEPLDIHATWMFVPPPPKLEDLETLDPELYVKLKCGSLKDDLSVPFISETDRLDIENFLESFTSPELTRNLLPVAIIGEGTFSTVYKVIDKNFYECDNSSWVEYSRQSPLDWLRLWRWVYDQESKDRLVLIKDGKRVVDRNGRTINTSNSTTSTTTTANNSNLIISSSSSSSASKNRGKLPSLLRRYLLEWAGRSLDSLQCGQEASESLFQSITPKVLQAAMLRFRPFFTALKRINATSSPQRILDEISFLKHLGGKNNVVPLINGMRCEDQVLVTFPYFYSEDFREFLGMSNFNINSIACYMRSLFISLAHLHSHGIIHRDIKPSNFLFAPENGGRAVLLDFGLAQKSTGTYHNGPKNVNNNNRNSHSLTQQHRMNTSRNNEKERKKLQAVNLILNALNPNNTNDGDACTKLTQLTGQLGPGYFNNDPRAGMKASRAGTRGFRAPEVLFKCPNQTTALDIWSAGVILLTLLTRRYPFFQSSDDFDAIVEIANIFGNEEMSSAAKLYSRRWLCNVPSVPEKHVTWPILCTRLNPTFVNEIPEECYDLLRECLNLNSDRRISAKSALKHSFITKYAK